VQEEPLLFQTQSQYSRVGADLYLPAIASSPTRYLDASKQACHRRRSTANVQPASASATARMGVHAPPATGSARSITPMTSPSPTNPAGTLP